MDIKYSFYKSFAQIISKLMKLGPSGGMSYPGYLFIKIGGMDSLNTLFKDRIKEGSILVTGTNGKTTTTTMSSDLLKKDINLVYSFENNTINALATSVIDNKGDLGLFEYGIRDKKHGMPDLVQETINPIGVVYTNVSREHAQVAGVKNPFEEYVDAKTLLSKGMMNGVVIANADDPIITNIGKNKQQDGRTIYYGFEMDNVEDIFEPPVVKCPKCGNTLNYSNVFLNQRGRYSCSCGFKRPEPDVKIAKFETNKDRWQITLDGNLYNYLTGKNIQFNVEVNVPLFGVHNLYNVLCATTVYACFTPKPENIEKNLVEYFNGLDFSILPPGRFELVDIGDKLVGLGQGDNGDALKVNITLMNLYSKDKGLEFIYTTPDENEEEIFEDHMSSIRSINPNHLIVVPGRVSVEKAREYYEQIKNEFDSEFYPLEFDLDKRVDALEKLIRQSDYKYVITTGCGEEQLLWDKLKHKLQK